MSKAHILLLAFWKQALATRRKRKTSDSSRRAPQQSRALDTIKVILEATARILEREGPGALNTNHIAERAGISVGSLYQYFPNKEAILVAIARGEIEADREAVMKAIANAPNDSLRSMIRPAIRAILHAFATRPEVRHLAFETFFAHGFGQEQAQALQEVAQSIHARSAQFTSTTAEPLPALRLFVVTRAIIGVLRAAAQEQSPFFGTQQFEDELVRMAEGLMLQNAG